MELGVRWCTEQITRRHPNFRFTYVPLANDLYREARRLGMELTQVEVDANDPAFQKPSKPIGPVYGKAEAEKLAAEKGLQFNFEGSMVAAIERFFSAFGGTLTPYHHITHERSKLLKLKKLLG